MDNAWITTEHPAIIFENNSVGRLKKEIWDAGEKEIDAILRYLTLLTDQILETFPAGTVPPAEKVTLRDPKELEPFLKEPFSDGWKSVFELPHVGPFFR